MQLIVILFFLILNHCLLIQPTDTLKITIKATGTATKPVSKPVSRLSNSALLKLVQQLKQRLQQSQQANTTRTTTHSVYQTPVVSSTGTLGNQGRVSAPSASSAIPGSSGTNLISSTDNRPVLSNTGGSLQGTTVSSNGGSIVVPSSSSSGTSSSTRTSPAVVSSNIDPGTISQTSLGTTSTTDNAQDPNVSLDNLNQDQRNQLNAFVSKQDPNLAQSLPTLLPPSADPSTKTTTESAAQKSGLKNTEIGILIGCCIGFLCIGLSMFGLYRWKRQNQNQKFSNNQKPLPPALSFEMSPYGISQETKVSVMRLEDLKKHPRFLSAPELYNEELEGKEGDLYESYLSPTTPLFATRRYE